MWNFYFIPDSGGVSEWVLLGINEGKMLGPTEVLFECITEDTMLGAIEWWFEFTSLGIFEWADYFWWKNDIEIWWKKEGFPVGKYEYTRLGSFDSTIIFVADSSKFGK